MEEHKEEKEEEEEEEETEHNIKSKNCINRNKERTTQSTKHTLRRKCSFKVDLNLQYLYYFFRKNSKNIKIICKSKDENKIK